MGPDLEGSEPPALQDTKAAALGSRKAPARGLPRRRGNTLPFSVLLTLAGGGMQGYANGTVDALFASMLLLVVGYLAVRIAFPHGRAEHRAYLQSYGVCVFAGGLAQCYSIFVFGETQSTVDAIGFFDAIFDRQPYYSWDEITSLWSDGKEVSRGAPLAVYIWQWVYHARLMIGLDFGVYFGVMFNAVIMGVTGSITVRTARELYGDDSWRLRRVGTLYAFCGLLILFGALFLRDCFVTMLNALVLWGIVRWLVRPTTRNLAQAGALTAVSLGAIMYLRARTAVMFGLFWIIGGVCWFFERRFNFNRLVAVAVVVLALLFGSAHLASYFQASRELQAKYLEVYTDHMGGEANSESLGMKLVVNQPLPVRLVLGTGALMILPVPLWAGFQPGMSEYHLIKSYHGVYQILVLPLVMAGFMLIGRRILANRGESLPFMYLAIYIAANVLSVVATSMEQRHVAQFMPAFMIVAALPDTRILGDRILVRNSATVWFSVVILVHLLWLIAATGR